MHTCKSYYEQEYKTAKGNETFYSRNLVRAKSSAMKSYYRKKLRKYREMLQDLEVFKNEAIRLNKWD